MTLILPRLTSRENAIMTDTELSRPSSLISDLNTLCGFGGRLCGTPSEASARDWLATAGSEAMGVPCQMHRISYDGWRATRAQIEVDGLAAPGFHPLVGSEATPSEGIEAEVLDLGRGLEEDFRAYGHELRGKIAMVSHEVMFSVGTFHRRRKLQLAREAGAVGAFVVSRLAGEPVAGSSRAEEPGLPAFGIAPELAAHLKAMAPPQRRARIMIDTEVGPTETSNLLFERPGSSGKWIVLSAHYDGHDLGESALDNATGVAVCLEVSRRLRTIHDLKGHGLRLAFFTVEEWGLLGSRLYVSQLSEKEKADTLLNLNVDTVVGGSKLTALTSEFKGLPTWLESESKKNGYDLGIHEPFQPNSDHANFARAGIPALRLVSGFNEPDSAVRFVLTSKDTRELVEEAELELAATLTENLTRAALEADEQTSRLWRG